MCIGLPMQVVGVEPGFAQVQGRGETRRVSTALVGQCEAGQWLLVFLGDARERLDAQRAAEVNAALDLMAAAFETGDALEMDNPGFVLPSSMNTATLQQLTGN